MDSHKEIHFPKSRIATLDVGEIGRKRHHIRALLEFDVTDARQALKAYRKKTKFKASFTAWLLKTISTTILEFQSSHAYLKTARKAIIFDDIDISITVERSIEGVLVPLPYVVRQTDKKNNSRNKRRDSKRQKSGSVRQTDRIGQKEERILY
jgi:hypothetical protein